MANQLHILKDADLIEILTLLQNGLQEDYQAYGMAESDLERLAQIALRFRTALTHQEIAEAAKLAATQAKHTAREEAIDEVSSLARRFYAHPTVTNAMLTEVGLEPRRGNRIRRTPQTPKALVAEPNAKGYVRFAWDRNGNPAHTVFHLQQAEADRWITLAAVMRQSLTLEGFPPGQPARFRVLAALGNRLSQPSNEFTIYASSPELAIGNRAA